MYLRRPGKRRGRIHGAPAARLGSPVQLLLELLEPRCLLTANDPGGFSGLDIHDPQIVVAQGEMLVPISPVESGEDVVSFYGYNTDNAHGSNTGYEASNRITLMVHEDPSAEIALVVVVDAPQDGDGGSIEIQMDGLQTASLTVVDDPPEVSKWDPQTGIFKRNWNQFLLDKYQI